MLNYIAAVSNNISFESIGLLVAGRPVATADLLEGPARAGIHLPAPPANTSREQPPREAPPALLAILINEDTRHLLGIQRASDFSGFGAGGTPLPDKDAAAPHTGASAATQAVSLAIRIGNRRQALAALEVFEAQRDVRLPQLSAGGRRGATLSAGIVQFQDLADLLTTFPCAVALAGRSLDHPDAVVYPQGEGFLAVPRKALLRDREVVVAHDLSNARRVRYTHDLRHWMPAGVYTDTVVEAEKLAMWTRIFTEASGRVTAAPADA